jgi:hypothetical protein
LHGASLIDYGPDFLIVGRQITGIWDFVVQSVQKLADFVGICRTRKTDDFRLNSRENFMFGHLPPSRFESQSKRCFKTGGSETLQRAGRIRLEFT